MFMMKRELEYSRFRVHGDQAMKAKPQIVLPAAIVRNEMHQKLKPIIKKRKTGKTARFLQPFMRWKTQK